jgi:hypothetical protein
MLTPLVFILICVRMRKRNDREDKEAEESGRRSRADSANEGWLLIGKALTWICLAWFSSTVWLHYVWFGTGFYPGQGRLEIAMHASFISVIAAWLFTLYLVNTPPMTPPAHAEQKLLIPAKAES